MNNTKKTRFLHIWNKLRGIPLEWDLGDYRKILDRINTFRLEELSNDDLKNVASRLATQAKKGVPLTDLMAETFALVRESSRREIGLRPFDIQVIAGIAMHQGKVIELGTGEGKTLAAVFPACLNALTGRGVHIHTFNDYLASRDAAWMGPIYRSLGLSVGCIQEGMSTEERRIAWSCDITYTTSREAGFDYLRDHLCYEKDELVHRDFHFAIIDEADSMLIDEARVPLVIAGRSGKTESTSDYLGNIARTLEEGLDFETDDEKRNVNLTEQGLKRVEEVLECENLYAPENFDLLTRVNLALHAEQLIHRDIDYIVRDGKIKIVDEFTGRVVEDRHWPDGLQAALEAKERLRRGSGGSILGSITLQHFLKFYPKLSGMTATARSAASEIHRFYGMTTVVIPQNRPCIRKDHPDSVFTSMEAKTKALIEEIKRCHATRRPVLVGTASVEESEKLSSALEGAGISCRVLNAKNDELEAKIIAQAGRPGTVTISTNMAGRGVDIKLGGDTEEERDEVIGLGGLYVIGTNRHESVRIDNQLRGRTGRQGDPGSSRFFTSFDDSLVQRYGIRKLLPEKLRDLDQKTPLDDPIVNREISRGQRIIEGQNFEIRKTLLKYSNIVEKQRGLVQLHRQKILVEGIQTSLIRENDPARYSPLESLLGRARLDEVERQITLYQIDRLWAEHLAFIADVREGIHLAGVSGNSPLFEFQKIVHSEFLKFEKTVEEGVIRTFRSLTIIDGKIDLDKEGIGRPSSTWTYVISDIQFGFWVGLLRGSNIGAVSIGASFFGLLFLIMGIVRRFSRKTRKK